jgi:predicted nucleotidyltransferase component of viral defense system
MNEIDRAEVGPFAYLLQDRDDAAGRADLRVIAPFGPRTNEPTEIQILSKVEFSPRQPWLTPETRPFKDLAVHRSYDLDGGLPALPVVRVEEAIAEKLARYARVGLARDLYDLLWYGDQGALDEALIRRLWVLKVYQDVVQDRRWSVRFDPATILIPRQAKDIDEESIGFLTQPIDIPGWERRFRERYAFLAHLDDEDSKWASCHRGLTYDFGEATKALEQPGGLALPATRQC